jgi:hypothetical protein
MAESIGITKLRGHEGRCSECRRPVEYIIICERCGVTLCPKHTYFFWEDPYCLHCWRKVRSQKSSEEQDEGKERLKVVPNICFKCGQIIAYLIVTSDFRGNVIYSRCDDCRRR